MYKVIGKEEIFKVLTLAEAMNVAKSMNEFVTIKGAKPVNPALAFWVARKVNIGQRKAIYDVRVNIDACFGRF